MKQGMRVQVEEAEAESTALKSRCAELSSALASLEATQAEATEVLCTAEEQMAELEDANAHLEAANADLEAANAQLVAGRAQLQHDVAAVSAERCALLPLAMCLNPESCKRLVFFRPHRQVGRSLRGSSVLESTIPRSLQRLWIS